MFSQVDFVTKTISTVATAMEILAAEDDED
jgi:hypothetical protein